MDLMSNRTTRRRFLCQAAAGGGLLMGRGLGWAAAPKPLADGARSSAANCPIAVVTAPVSSDMQARGSAWCYIREVLQHAGLFFDQMSPDDLASLHQRSVAVVLLVGELPLTSSQRESLIDWVRNGGSLIGIGGTSGLDTVFGIRGKRPLAEGWMKVTCRGSPRHG